MTEPTRPLTETFAAIEAEAIGPVLDAPRLAAALGVSVGTVRAWMTREADRPGSTVLAGIEPPGRVSGTVWTVEQARVIAERHAQRRRGRPPAGGWPERQA